jgi:hypothetical protein
MTGARGKDIVNSDPRRQPAEQAQFIPFHGPSNCHFFQLFLSWDSF